MDENVFHLPKPTFASLIDGLINDFKTLIRQEIQLARDEVRTELGKARSAMLSLAVGLGLTIIGGLLLIIMLVWIVEALTHLPLWACYGIVGGAFAIAGLILMLRGKRQAEAFHFVPPRTLETIKENATWIKEQATSNKM